MLAYNPRFLHHTSSATKEVFVRRFGSAFSVTMLLLISAGCGSSSSRQLQSINISPTTASGQAQFVATGQYNQAPLSMSPLPAMWVIYLPGGETGATITQDGVAQCEPGASKTFSVLAYAPADPTAPIKIPLTGKLVLGMAVLNCP